MRKYILVTCSTLLLVSGCKQNKFDDALGEITQSSKDLTKCYYEERLSDTVKCSRLKYDIAIDKAKVIGIQKTRINAASDLGMKLYESENPELVSKVKAELAANSIDTSMDAAADAAVAAEAEAKH